jgi:hypothetical protein
MPAVLLTVVPLPLQLLERLQSLTFLLPPFIFVLAENGVTKLAYFQQLFSELAIVPGVTAVKCVITG